MPSDNELIAQFISSQDKLAFTLLVKRYQSAIRHFLRRLSVGNYALADDVAQETFLIMYRKLHTFNGKSALSTWLHKIAYHSYLQYQQKEKPSESFDYLAFDEVDTGQADPSSDVLAEQLMSKLSLDERVTLTLMYSAGMSHSEIVIATDYPLGTVKSHINRAKIKLAKYLAQQGEENENPNE
jgi:RNA polymerase sigma-70 factor (ECF subfamily)